MSFAIGKLAAEPANLYNLRMSEPIKLMGLNVSGFSANHALAGEMVQIVTRAALTSDEREFYLYMKGITSLLSARLTAADRPVLFNCVHALLVVVHDDQSADIYLNDFPVLVHVRAKHDMNAGAVLAQGSIADVGDVEFRDIQFNPSDKVIACLKVGWKFALYFDLGDARTLDTAGMSASLGHLYRILLFQDVYEALADDAVFAVLLRDGWFPFIEILGGPFETLLDAYKHAFNVEGAQKRLVERFTLELIDSIAARWGKRACLAGREKIVHSALDAFKRGDAIACTKILLTEIEGVLRDAHITELGRGATVKELLSYAIAHGAKKTQSETSLFFPHQFLRYLSESTYGRFDAVAGTGATASRHGVSHGAAKVEEYTPARALQAILTLDQLAFYLN